MYLKNSGFLVFIGMLFWGCAGHVISKESPLVNVVPKNQKFTIILPEDHREGATWQLVEDYDHSVIRRLNEVWHGNEKGIYFNLETKTNGETVVRLVKRKYTDTIDNKRFIIIVGS